MLKRVIVLWLVVAAAIAITAGLMPSVEIGGGLLALLGTALVFGFINAFVGPLLRLISLPLTVVTMGLFTLVINGALLGLTAGLLDSFDVGGFFPTIGAAILISALTTGLWFVTGRRLPALEYAD